MLSIRLDAETQKRIDKLAASTKRSKSFFVKEALANYLDDLEDYYEASKRKNSNNRELISFNELKEALGV
ncbi:MAG TPA: ribbon-helix-helix domain-containing protein [Sulfurovum sp.]|nr:MAG: CopG family transcriptional regulator [Sulfurovum sp. 28-43-6]OYZ25649.1 MAG: CopG family transcriptional regulator [Sulfurovum sp. 16-42-52]OYZ49758.1 MAG: CopG family transcriptional regulator [Sulfurovum sp. 24-42-9]OZA45767.1 MAG: CopG family transcriptional regulator [Sulfurovum sp. 17-42-90]OZA61579.1 MAG: CopG family transcriptional regulator [Sulfurovum sp. 39-42-12]HQR74666.1 ribbon-helix-helix domain-containing protein [Sulfurovum sp.]